MNVLLIGGAGSLIDNLIIKLNKAGHRIYLLTGSRYQHLPYQKVFERYDFTYDAECLGDIFESTAPDVTVFMGAFDSNFKWQEEEKTAVRFSTSLTNILMSYAMNAHGRFIFLSSDEVFGNDRSELYTEEDETTPAGLKGLALAQAEALCESYQSNRKLDVTTLRLDHLYCMPRKRAEVADLPAKMCLEALESNTITIVPYNKYAFLYETDAVEDITRMIVNPKHDRNLYQISSEQIVTEKEVAEMVKSAMGDTVEIVDKPVPGIQVALSGQRFAQEFGQDSFCEMSTIIKKTADTMRKNSYVFLTGEEKEPSFFQKFVEKSGWLMKAMVPFLENFLIFLIVFGVTNLTMDSKYFAQLDLYLLYVLLFAIVYGQQQATFSAVLASLGYCIQKSSGGSPLSVVLDANTYVWIAQLFILGLAVGYLKDQISVLKKEGEESKEFLSVQLSDIQEINNSNVRVKNALETQLINQNDSVGKIYKITSALDYYSPEEVLFYAADVIRQLMGSKDVAIYAVSNADYARIFSSTSQKAREMGNSIRYTEMGELYEELSKHKVFINRKMDERYPLMANAIFEEDRMQLMIFVWGIPWEHMTLGQANQLVIASALIQEAVLRANRYLAILENDRYIGDSRMLESDAFTKLTHAYQTAQFKGLAECTVLRVITGVESVETVGKKLAEMLRQTDYIGTLSDGRLYTLLANTTGKDAVFVINRFKEAGYETEVVEEVSE